MSLRVMLFRKHSFSPFVSPYHNSPVHHRYIVVVKVGKPTERTRPGNRGKRDSQILLMQYLNRVHFDSPMTPLELEIYHQMRNVIGIDPAFYEYIFTIDADTVRSLRCWYYSMISLFITRDRLLLQTPLTGWLRLQQMTLLSLVSVVKPNSITRKGLGGQWSRFVQWLWSPQHITQQIVIGLRVLHLSSFVQGFREFVRLGHMFAGLFLHVQDSNCWQGTAYHHLQPNYRGVLWAKRWYSAQEEPAVSWWRSLLDYSLAQALPYLPY